jgi:hypothetical protein
MIFMMTSLEMKKTDNGGKIEAGIGIKDYRPLNRFRKRTSPVRVSAHPPENPVLTRRIMAEA